MSGVTKIDTYDGMSPVALMAAAERLTGGVWGVNVGAEILGLSLDGEGGGDVIAIAGHLGCSSAAWGVLFEGGTVAPPLRNAATVSKFILEHQDALRARSTQVSPPSALQEEWANSLAPWYPKGRRVFCDEEIWRGSGVPDATRVPGVPPMPACVPDEAREPLKKDWQLAADVIAAHRKMTEATATVSALKGDAYIPMRAPKVLERRRPRPVTPPQRIRRIRYGGAR